VLTGLELDRLGLDSPVAPMSGGERRAWRWPRS
jgi:ATP-binding cassette subfamily F protein uup